MFALPFGRANIYIIIIDIKFIQLFKKIYSVENIKNNIIKNIVKLSVIIFIILF